MNVVQESRPGRGRTRRDDAREARRREFLAAARDLVEEHGLDALTIKGLAARLDCAVGSLYTYFASKDALVAAMQAAAIEALDDAYAAAAARLEPRLADLDEPAAAVARLVAFGRFVVAAEQHLPREFHLQQALLATPGGITDPAEVAKVVPVAFRLLERPERLLAAAEQAGAVDAGPAFDRTITWVAALNGVLLLSRLTDPDAVGREAHVLADRLTVDLLAGWGAPRAALDAADLLLSPSLLADLLTPHGAS